MISAIDCIRVEFNLFSASIELSLKSNSAVLAVKLHSAQLAMSTSICNRFQLFHGRHDQEGSRLRAGTECVVT